MEGTRITIESTSTRIGKGIALHFEWSLRHFPDSLLLAFPKLVRSDFESAVWQLSPVSSELSNCSTEGNLSPGVGCTQRAIMSIQTWSTAWSFFSRWFESKLPKVLSISLRDRR